MRKHTKYSVSVYFSAGVGVSWISSFRKATWAFGLHWSLRI